jgi:integrase
MSVFTSPLASHFDRFLEHKLALGFAYHREKAFLRELDRFAALSNGDVLSETLVRGFLSGFSHAARSARLTLVRQLAHFLVLEDPRTFVPPRRFLGIRRKRAAIRVLSRDEACRFLDSCDRLPDTARYARRLIHGTALRVLLLTGLRQGEAIALCDQDVDLSQDIITVCNSKFGKTRFVPLAPDLVARLENYRQSLADHIAPRRPSDAFFPGPGGHKPTCHTSLYKSFRIALDLAGIAHYGRGRGPRLHDLRHTFAVLRLLSWYEAGADLGNKLPLLATYLGHVGLATSQAYLHMTRDLVGEVTRRELDRFGDLITAVPS